MITPYGVGALNVRWNLTRASNSLSERDCSTLLNPMMGRKRMIEENEYEKVC